MAVRWRLHVSKMVTVARATVLAGATCHGEDWRGHRKKERGEAKLVLTVSVAWLNGAASVGSPLEL